MSRFGNRAAAPVTYALSTAGPDVRDAEGRPVAVWRVGSDGSRAGLLADGTPASEPVRVPRHAGDGLVVDLGAAS